MPFQLGTLIALVRVSPSGKKYGKQPDTGSASRRFAVFATEGEA
jgi:hypothetical protein